MASRPADELLAAFGADPAGAEAAFGELVRRYAGMVFATCLRVTKDAHDAEDATQAAFLTLAVQCKTGKSVRRLTPWLQQVAKRAALDLRRSRKRRETHEHRHSAMTAHANGHTNGEPAATPHPGTAGAGASARRSDEHDAEKVNKVLAEEVAKLPAKYRMPLVSLYFGGMNRQEVAKELGCTPAALSVRVHRGRQMLGRRLTARGIVVGTLGHAARAAGRGAGGHLMLGGLLAGGASDALRESMVARTAEAVAQTILGRNLAASVSSNVLSLVRLSTVGGAGALLAKLKVPVMLVLLLAAVTASAAGSSARVRETIRDAVSQWSGQLQLAPAVRRVMQMFRSPFRAPQVSSNASAATSAAGNGSTGAAPVGGAGGAPNLLASGAPQRSAARAEAARELNSAAGAVGSASPRAAGLGVVTSVPPSGAAPTNPAPGVPQRRATTPAAIASAPAPAEVARALPPRRVETPESREPHGTGQFTRDPGGAMLSVGADRGSIGTFTLPGGPFSGGAQDIGRQGTGRLVQLGGTNFGTRLDLGAGAGGLGTYDLGNGSFVLSGPPASLTGGVYVGGAGQGVLNLGNARTSGSVLFPGWFDPSGSAHARGSVASVGDGSNHGGNTPTPAPASDFVVRGDPAGSGMVRGWGGAVGNGGVFVENGRVIADGYGQPRSLIFLGYRAVTNTIDNPDANGDNGWFARNGGRLILPKLATARGTNTYNWGENPADPTIDLVNSVRLTLRDAEHAGKIDISLLDKTRPDVPDLPKGHTFIGVWSIDTGLTRPDGGVDLTVRYDDGLAHHLGLNENVLKLWQFEGDRWVRINDASFSRDTARNTLSGHANPDLSFFAVSAPEPSSLVVVMLAGGALMLRRGRRRK